MDTKEIKQEIEKLAADIVHSSSAEPFQRLMAWSALLEIEKENAINKRFEETMPMILEGLKVRERKMASFGSDETYGILRAENQELRDHLGQAQNDLRLLSKDVITQAAKAMTQTTTLDRARLEMLAGQEDVYDLEEKYEEVDWEGVHGLRIRAPRHLGYSFDGPEPFDEGTWFYISRDGGVTRDECHVTALGYLNDDTAAVYRVVDEKPGRAHLYWERRFLHTAQMTKEELEDLKREQKRRQK